MLFYHLPRAYAPGESLPHVVGGERTRTRTQIGAQRTDGGGGGRGKRPRLAGDKLPSPGASRQLQLGTGRPVERSCAGTVGREQAER